MNEDASAFQIHRETVREEPIVSLLTLKGRFDAEGIPPVLAEIDTARVCGCSRFVVDLDRITFIGSAGIGIFLSLVEEMQNEGGGVVFQNIPESIVQIFEVLNVLEFLDIRNDCDTAVDFLLSKNAVTGAGNQR